MVEEVGALIGLSYLAQDCLGLFRSSLFETKGRTYKWLVTKLKAIDIIKTAARRRACAALVTTRWCGGGGRAGCL